MTETRVFPTSVVLSAVTGKWLGESFNDLHGMLDFVLADTLMTHQLGNAGLAAQPDLRRQFPWVEDLPPIPEGEFPVRAWLAKVEEQYGKTLPVVPVVAAGWIRYNALRDLNDIAGDKPIIIVEVDPTP